MGQEPDYGHERPEYRLLGPEPRTNVDGTRSDGSLGNFVAAGKGALAGPVRVVVGLKATRTNLDAKQCPGTMASRPPKSLWPKARRRCRKKQH
jgi:hypothetical protein